MSFELVSIPTGEPAVIPASTGRHRGPGRSVNWFHQPRHRHGPISVVELLPVPTGEFFRYEGPLAIAPWEPEQSGAFIMIAPEGGIADLPPVLETVP